MGIMAQPWTKIESLEQLEPYLPRDAGRIMVAFRGEGWGTHQGRQSWASFGGGKDIFFGFLERGHSLPPSVTLFPVRKKGNLTGSGVFFSEELLTDARLKKGAFSLREATRTERRIFNAGFDRGDYLLELQQAASEVFAVPRARQPKPHARKKPGHKPRPC